MSVAQSVLFVNDDRNAGRAGDGTFTLGGTTWPGDLQFLITWADDGTHAITTNGGSAWTALTGSPFSGPTGEKMYVWYRIAQSGDTAPIITVSGSTVTTSSHMAVLCQYADGSFDPTTPIDAIGTAANGTSNVATLNSVTTTVPNAKLISITGQGANTNTSTISQTGQTYVEQVDVGTASGNDSRLSISDSTKAAAGTPASGTIALGAVNPWINIGLAIRPRLLAGNTTHASWAAAVAASSPRNWLKFDDTSGTTAVDSGGTPVDGTYVGSPTLGAPKVIANGSGSAVSLDGVDDEVTHAVTLPVGAFTMEMWIDDWDTADPDNVLVRDNTSTGGFIPFWVNNSLYTARIAGTDVGSVAASSAVKDLGRHYLVVQRSTDAVGNVRLWLDGKVVGSAVATTGASVSPLHYGKNGTGSGFPKYRLDDALIHTTIFTAAQIVARYEAGLVASAAPSHNPLALLGVG